MSGVRRTSGAMALGEKLLASYFQSYLSNREESKVNMGRLKPVVEKNQFWRATDRTLLEKWQS